jgi:hypothetical protein
MDRFRPSFEDFVKKAWPEAKILIATWWDDYKNWEREDTIGMAFWDSRLTSRTWAGDLEYEEVMKPAANKISDTKGIKGKAKSDPVVARFDSYEYKRSVGMASLVRRTTPENFYPGSGQGSRKTEMGLHDMSVTLLNPRKPIRDQAHSKADGTIFSFMPLSDPLDQVVFQTLNRTGKDLRQQNSELYDMVREMRSKMTRIKLAAEHDLGTGFSAVERQNGHGFKITYGLGAKTKVINEKTTEYKEGGGKTKLVDVTPEILKARRDAAMDFRSIVSRLLFDHTEIIVAYRKHAGNFPVFAQLNLAQKRFDPYRNAGLPTIAEPFRDPPFARPRGG